MVSIHENEIHALILHQTAGDITGRLDDLDSRGEPKRRGFPKRLLALVGRKQGHNPKKTRWTLRYVLFLKSFDELVALQKLLCRTNIHERSAGGVLEYLHILGTPKVIDFIDTSWYFYT